MSENPSGVNFPATPQTVEQREAEQRALYGKWVAVVPITIDGARAFNPGDGVPTTHVDNGLVPKSSVVTRASQTGQAVTTTEKG